MHLPTGNVTYLLTDIEGSTKLVDRLGDQYGELLGIHHRLIRDTIAANNGVELGTEGDSFFAVFQTTHDAVAAAIASQRVIASDPQLAAESVKVRMGLHAGTAQLGGDNYVGLDVHVAARIQSAAHGGQILASNTVAADVPTGVEALDLGSYWLKDIAEPVRLFQISAEGIEGAFEPVNAAPTHPQNAPRDLSSFIGRDDDIERTVKLLSECRLVTLTRPGGTGKTRLSIKVGSKASRSFKDGVYFVPLAGIDDEESVPNAIIDAVGIRNADPSVPPIDIVRRHLADQESLIILDNMEHVLGATPHVQVVLDSAPKTSVLATSRTPLKLRGERELAIQPLDVKTTAMQLFADRASAVNASFELDDDNRGAIAEIVQRVDGLPLAIELAAARTRMMSPASILATLDPLSLATSATSIDGQRGLTLNDTIQWSFDLLTEPEQQLLIRLGVFPTGAGLDEINAVCQPGAELGLDLINGIGALVEHSLLIGDESTGTPRFRMLETIREFASRRLADSTDEQLIRQRHLETFTDLLERARPKLDSSEAATWMTRLGIENGNVQAAFAYAVETGNAEHAQRIVHAAWRFWLARGHLAQGSTAATQALALDGAPLDVTAMALDAAGSIAYWVGDAAATRAYYDEAVALRRSMGTTEGLANALFNLSFPVTDQDGLEAATALIDEALEIAVVEGNYRLQLLATMSMARAWLRTDPHKAIEYANQAITFIDRVDDPVSHGSLYSILGVALFATGDTPAAVAQLQRGLEIFHTVGDYSGISIALVSIAHIARNGGADEVALYIVGAVHQLRKDYAIGVTTAMDDTIKEFESIESVEALPPNLRSRYDQGRTDDLDTAVAFALAWTPDDA